MSAVGLGQSLGDGQPDPGATMVAVAGGVAAVEAFEEVGQLLGADAVAGVGDTDGHPPWALSVGAERDLSASWGVAQGVGEQVAQHLAHALPVGRDVSGGLVDVDVQGHAFGGVGLPVGLGGRAHQLGHRLFGAVQDDAALLRAGDVVDVFHQPGEAGELFPMSSLVVSSQWATSSWSASR